MFQRSSSLMRLVCDASQNLAEISLRVQTIELRRGNETVDNGGTLSSGIGTGSALILIMTEGEQGGNASLFINDKNVGEGRVEKTVVARFSADETFDLGMDTGTPVSADYLSPNAFNGKLKSAKIELRASRLSVEEERQVRVLNQRRYWPRTDESLASSRYVELASLTVDRDSTLGSITFCRMYSARTSFVVGHMKSIAFKSGILFTAAVLVTLSGRLESQADFDSFFSKFEAAVMSADTYQLQNLMADKFDFMGITDASPQDVFKGLGSGQWPNLQSAVKNKVFVTQPYNGKPARFLRCTPPTAHNNCYVIFQNDSSGHWRWKAMVMPEK